MPVNALELGMLVVYGFLFGLGFHLAEIALRRLGR